MGLGWSVGRMLAYVLIPAKSSNVIEIDVNSCRCCVYDIIKKNHNHPKYRQFKDKNAKLNDDNLFIK